MCFECPEHGTSSGSVTASAKAALVSVAVAAVVVATYRAMEVVWPLYLILLVAGYLWVYAVPPLRTLVRHARRLRAQRHPAAALAEYSAVLAVTSNGQTRTLMAGPVPGQWRSAGDVTQAIAARYVAAFGMPAGELTCRAEPVRVAGQGGAS